MVATAAAHGNGSHKHNGHANTDKIKKQNSAKKKSKPPLIVLVADEQPKKLHPADLDQSDWEELREYCDDANGNVVFNINRYPDWPTEARLNLLAIARDLGKRSRVALNNVEHHDPFEAVLASMVGIERLDAYKKSFEAVCEAAGFLHGEMGPIFESGPVSVVKARPFGAERRSGSRRRRESRRSARGSSRGVLEVDGMGNDAAFPWTSRTRGESVRRLRGLGHRRIVSHRAAVLTATGRPARAGKARRWTAGDHWIRAWGKSETDTKRPGRSNRRNLSAVAAAEVVGSRVGWAIPNRSQLVAHRGLSTWLRLITRESGVIR